MSTVKKGMLTNARDWAKHLRWYGHKLFWRGERQAQRADIAERLEDDYTPEEADGDVAAADPDRKLIPLADLVSGKHCYQCDAVVDYLFGDSRCGKCTRFTPDNPHNEED